MTPHGMTPHGITPLFTVVMLLCAIAALVLHFLPTKEK